MQNDPIPGDVFNVSGCMSNNSGDFFMGLSCDTDPTKDLPPVDVSGDDVVEVSNMGLTGDVRIPLVLQ